MHTHRWAQKINKKPQKFLKVGVIPKEGWAPRAHPSFGMTPTQAIRDLSAHHDVSTRVLVMRTPEQTVSHIQDNDDSSLLCEQSRDQSDPAS